MELKEAIEILELHNKWRTDKEDIYTQLNSKDITKAIDIVLQAVRNIGDFRSVSIQFHCEKEANNFGCNTQCDHCKELDVDEY